MTCIYLLISFSLLSGLSNCQQLAFREVNQVEQLEQLTKKTESQETSEVTLTQDCCSSLYKIGQDVGALTETLRSTIRRLDETTSKQEETIRKQEETIRRLDETTSRLEASEAQLAALNNTLSTVLNKENIYVAFTASWPVEGSQTAGTEKVPIVYKHVSTNLGNAYSPVTGFFTAPVKGVYSFSFTSFYWGGSETSGGSLYHNEAPVVSWFRKNVTHTTSGSNSAVLMLNAGDKVNVYLWAKRTIADNEYKYSTFSGFLLYTL